MAVYIIYRLEVIKVKDCQNSRSVLALGLQYLSSSPLIIKSRKRILGSLLLKLSYIAEVCSMSLISQPMYITRRTPTSSM